jgi:hypothetical protein
VEPSRLVCCSTGYVLMDIDALLQTSCHPAAARPTTTSRSRMKEPVKSDSFSMAAIH